MSTATMETSFTESGLAETTGSLQLVSFRLADETYGIEITKIREIILIGEITRIPQTPHYVKGLINLRSTVIPVIDLRARFDLPDAELTDESRIMVLNVAGKTVGIVVDGVSEVLRVSNEHIAPPPATVAGLSNQYLDGLVKLEDQLLILLNIEKILAEESETLAAAVAAAG
ncbi:MAG: purine-binding chemotaxis protein CheW [Candidatus Nealsonbacteria bacterium]|nr:purine-binding chemotaxis protein CheW [Candidatus Nealsonbacteria bacterium]